MTSPVVLAQDLVIRFGDTTVVDHLSFDVFPGECVAIVGESGSGKSVTARSLLGLVGTGSDVSAQTLQVAGENVLTARTRELRKLRGGSVGYIAQDALVSLDPLRPVGREINDTLALHTTLGAAARQARVIELLASVGLERPDEYARRRPDQLSGGQRQRALIAAGIAARPALVIADEPTTSLDQNIAAGVLDLLASLRDGGTAVLLISHDLAAVSRVADRIFVMTGGVIVEHGAAADVLDRPRTDYTKRLLASNPAGRPRGSRLVPEAVPAPVEPGIRQQKKTSVVMETTAISRTFGSRRSPVTAVSDVSLQLHAGRTLGLIGESGSGKTTTARLMLALDSPDSGAVTLNDGPWSVLREAQRRSRRHRVGAVFQDPLSSFDPRWTVAQILLDAASAGRMIRTGGQNDTAEQLLASVGLSPDLATRRPLTLSGGQRQRVAIARALATNPQILVLDEPVSSLDVTVQAQILDTLDDLQLRRGLSYLLISHDLGVIEHMSDDIVVMYRGHIVEHGPTTEVLRAPQHPYTRSLLAARESPRS